MAQATDTAANASHLGGIRRQDRAIGNVIEGATETFITVGPATAHTISVDRRARIRLETPGKALTRVAALAHTYMAVSGTTVFIPGIATPPRAPIVTLRYRPANASGKGIPSGGARHKRSK